MTYAGGSRPTLQLIERDPVRVMIADPQPVVRTGFAAMLESEKGMDVIGTAATATEAVAMVSVLQPDVVLISLDLPGAGGLEAARQIHDDPDSAQVNVMILADAETDDDLFAALRSGASGFVLKSAEPAELARAVRVAADGGALLSPHATRRLIAEFRAQPEPSAPSQEQLDALTAREREIMALVGIGFRNHEIAERLVISPATVKTHVSRVLRKLDVHDRSQLVATAYQLGLVGVGERGIQARGRPVLTGAAPTSWAWNA
jgi:DNA-binding NarL/FixJ family response regulator